jgi:alpha-ketoglutarate-dependent taurine dioxygenase
MNLAILNQTLVKATVRTSKTVSVPATPHLQFSYSSYAAKCQTTRPTQAGHHPLRSCKHDQQLPSIRLYAARPLWCSTDRRTYATQQYRPIPVNKPDPRLKGQTPLSRTWEASTPVFDENGRTNINPIFLRDACDCHLCVDPSTRQRNFSVADIPVDIQPVLKETDASGALHVAWVQDVPSFDSSHVSVFSKERLQRGFQTRVSPIQSADRQLWTKDDFVRDGCWMDYENFVANEESLKKALASLVRDGLLFITGVPPESTSVGTIAERIGPLKNTFYGSTWDVRSKADAKNVAYTSKYLGFHMDLLYLKQPPAYQLLHCIHNSCAGGESRFVDTFKAASIIAKENPTHALRLTNQRLAYEYLNDNQQYYHAWNIFHMKKAFGRSVDLESTPNAIENSLDTVNWSPEFLASPSIRPSNDYRMTSDLHAMKFFAQTLERDELVYEVKMDEGTCVIFENRRVAHARNAFQTGTGERWLRGAYLDGDVVASKLNTLGLLTLDDAGAAPLSHPDDTDA